VLDPGSLVAERYSRLDAARVLVLGGKAVVEHLFGHLVGVMLHLLHGHLGHHGHVGHLLSGHVVHLLHGHRHRHGHALHGVVDLHLLLRYHVLLLIMHLLLHHVLLMLLHHHLLLMLLLLLLLLKHLLLLLVFHHFLLLLPNHHFLLLLLLYHFLLLLLHHHFLLLLLHHHFLLLLLHHFLLLLLHHRLLLLLHHHRLLLLLLLFPLLHLPLLLQHYLMLQLLLSHFIFLLCQSLILLLEQTRFLLFDFLLLFLLVLEEDGLFLCEGGGRWLHEVLFLEVGVGFGSGWGLPPLTQIVNLLTITALSRIYLRRLRRTRHHHLPKLRWNLTRLLLKSRTLRTSLILRQLDSFLHLHIYRLVAFLSVFVCLHQISLPELHRHIAVLRLLLLIAR
jgi:hypothetical protein